MFTKTLSEDAQKSLALLGKGILPKGTYLAGGSALALSLGHRISVDFDFFTNIAFLSSNLEKSLKNLGEFETKTVLSDTLLGIFNGVRFSIFYYNYPLLFPVQKFLGIKVADPKDIGAMKIAAVMDRGTKKEFLWKNALKVTTKNIKHWKAIFTALLQVCRILLTRRFRKCRW